MVEEGARATVMTVASKGLSSLQSVMIWGAIPYAGVGPLCCQVKTQCSHLPGNCRALDASVC